MRKFAKYSLITAIIIMLIGIVIYIAGLAGGGRQDVLKMAADGRLHLFNSKLDSARFGIGWFHDEITGIDFDDEFPVSAGDAEELLDAASINKIDVDLGGGQLFIGQGTEKGIQITSKKADDFQYYVKDHTLYMKGFKKWKAIDADKNIVYVSLPENLEFKESEISLGAGRIEIKDSALGDTDIEVGAGEIEASGIRTRELQVEIGAGRAYLENIEITGELNVNVAMGEAVLNGIFQDSIDLECAMGSIELEIDGNKEDYNYELEGALGNVELEGEDYASVLTERKINNNSNKTLKAECSMGNISIGFK